MRAFQDSAAAIFIGSVFLLTTISILGVWDLFSGDVIEKSFMTLGLLAIVAVITMFAGRFIDTQQLDAAMPPPSARGFKMLRHGTLYVLIAATAVLALVGVMAIWEVIRDMDILYRSLGSLGILAFSSFVVVMVCLERERFFQNRSKAFSVGGVIALLFFGYVCISIFSSFMRWF